MQLEGIAKRLNQRTESSPCGMSCSAAPRWSWLIGDLSSMRHFLFKKLSLLTLQIYTFYFDLWVSPAFLFFIMLNWYSWVNKWFKAISFAPHSSDKLWSCRYLLDKILKCREILLLREFEGFNSWWKLSWIYWRRAAVGNVSSKNNSSF